MAWLKFLTDISLLVTVGVDAIVLCHVFPAFRRSGNKAFLFITIAAILGIVDTVYDHTIRLRGVNDQVYIFIRTLRRFGYFADLIFWCMGIVLLARPFLRSDGSGNTPDPSPRSSGGSAKSTSAN